MPLNKRKRGMPHHGEIASQAPRSPRLHARKHRPKNASIKSLPSYRPAPHSCHHRRGPSRLTRQRQKGATRFPSTRYTNNWHASAASPPASSPAARPHTQSPLSPQAAPRRAATPTPRHPPRWPKRWKKAHAPIAVQPIRSMAWPPFLSFYMTG